MLNTTPANIHIAEHDKRFDDILKLSRNMHEAAGKGEWEQILKMQTERQQMMDNYFAEPVPAEQAEKVATGIREMLDMDRVLMDRSRQQMSSLSSDMQSISQGVKAQKAYGDNM